MIKRGRQQTPSQARNANQQDPVQIEVCGSGQERSSPKEVTSIGQVSPVCNLQLCLIPSLGNGKC